MHLERDDRAIGNPRTIVTARPGPEFEAIRPAISRIRHPLIALGFLGDEETVRVSVRNDRLWRIIPRQIENANSARHAIDHPGPTNSKGEPYWNKDPEALLKKVEIAEEIGHQLHDHIAEALGLSLTEKPGPHLVPPQSDEA